MIAVTTLKAGQTVRITRTGSHFYLLSAVDVVNFKFTKSTGLDIVLSSDFREGMSADFPVKINTVEIFSKTAQRIEYWLADTKLDYSKLAAGGASSTVDSGRAVCDLGQSLAIPADFRRKSINIQALTEVTIGGLGVETGNGYLMKAGETLKLGTRGDIYSYLTPARIDKVETNVTFTALPAAHGDESGFANTDVLSVLFFDKKTKNLITGAKKLVYSIDNGINWLDSDITGAGTDSANNKITLGQNDSGVFVADGDGRVIVSRDGGLSFSYVAGLAGATNLDTNALIVSPFLCASGWISADEKNILLIDYYGVWESFDGGKGWHNYKTALFNYGDGITVTKSGGALWVARQGNMYLFDYETKSFTKKTFIGEGSGDDFFAAFGSKIYHFNNQTNKLTFTDNGGDTSTVISMPATVGFIKAYGDSLLISDIDRIGVVKVAGGDVVWYVADVVSGKTKGGGRLVVTDNSIIVKQKHTTKDLLPTATIYPAAIVAGAEYPAPLQWLAELN